MKTPLIHNSNLQKNASPNVPQSKDSLSIKAIFYLVALVVLSESFWKFLNLLFGDATEFTSASIIIKAFILALGLVAFTVKWEISLKILPNLWIMIFPLLLAYASAIWSISPYDTIRGSLMFLLLIFFALAMAIDINYKSFAIICAVAALIINGLDYGYSALSNSNQSGLALNSANVALLMASSICALLASRAKRIIWILLSIFAISLAILQKSLPILAESVTLVGAFGLGIINKARLRPAQKYALNIATLIFISTATLIFFGSYFSTSLNELFDHLGSRAIFGNGFETAGNEISKQFGIGLGALGVGTALIALFGSIATAYIQGRMSLSNSILIIGIGAILVVAPNQIELIGPISIIFIAAIYKSIIARFKLKLRLTSHLTSNGNRRPNRAINSRA